MEALLAALRAAAEPTRLRILAICAEGEMTVSEITQVLAQSQPRVSRHLKLLCDAGLLDRFREGNWVFYRLADGGDGAGLVRDLIKRLPRHDEQIGRDAQRLAAIKTARAERAAAYFGANAESWHRIRSLHVDEAEVENALVALLAPRRIDDLLDIGTGTARMLELFAPTIARGLGIDMSRDMLAVARARLAAAGLHNCQVRQDDMYGLSLADASFDAVIFHQVLHFADRPAGAIDEAARVLRPGGILAIVDFAPHALEELRNDHAHRRLGFSDAEVGEWCAGADLRPGPAICLPGTPLTVNIWPATRPAAPARRAVPHAASSIAQEVPRP
jgi:ubiquinone/menaquinone biosynthesis C-methylase UbiE/DNA-binding transcriptional ArsR family regulator